MIWKPSTYPTHKHQVADNITVFVKELGMREAELIAKQEPEDEFSFRMLVACVLDDQKRPVFTSVSQVKEQIADLSLPQLSGLYDAIAEHNGFNKLGEKKSSHTKT